MKRVSILNYTGKGNGSFFSKIKDYHIETVSLANDPELIIIQAPVDSYAGASEYTFHFNNYSKCDLKKVPVFITGPSGVQFFQISAVGPQHVSVFNKCYYLKEVMDFKDNALQKENKEDDLFELFN